MQLLPKVGSVLWKNMQPLSCYTPPLFYKKGKLLQSMEKLLYFMQAFICPKLALFRYTVPLTHYQTPIPL